MQRVAQRMARHMMRRLQTAFSSREHTGRPLASQAFINYLEEFLGRTLKPGIRDPKTNKDD